MNLEEFWQDRLGGFIILLISLLPLFPLYFYFNSIQYHNHLVSGVYSYIGTALFWIAVVLVYRLFNERLTGGQENKQVNRSG